MHFPDHADFECVLIVR